MTDQTTPRRDHRGPIITADTLRTWGGTDAELGRTLGVSRQAVTYARRVHQIAAPVNGRYGPRPGLSRSVCTAIVKESKRRGCTVAEVLLDLNVWADSAEGPEVEPVAKAKPCERCGDENATHGPCPYAADVNGDDTPVWLCEPCREEGAMDV